MAKTKSTEAMVETFLRILHDQVLRGKRAENGFKKKAWIVGYSPNGFGSKSTKDQMGKCMLAETLYL